MKMQMPGTCRADSRNPAERRRRGPEYTGRNLEDGAFSRTGDRGRRVRMTMLDLFVPVATHIVRHRSGRRVLLALIEPTSVSSPSHWGWKRSTSTSLEPLEGAWMSSSRHRPVSLAAAAALADCPRGARCRCENNVPRVGRNSRRQFDRRSSPLRVPG
jgi:hypothetical protein